MPELKQKPNLKHEIIAQLSKKTEQNYQSATQKSDEQDANLALRDIEQL